MNIECFTVYIILMSVTPNPPMKAEPCLLFSWIWKVVNYFFQLKVKFQVIITNINFLWGLCSFTCWFVFVIIFLVTLLEPSKMKTSPIYFSSRSWYFWLNFNFSCTVFPLFIHSHAIAFLNHDKIIYVSLE